MTERNRARAAHARRAAARADAHAAAAELRRVIGATAPRLVEAVVVSTIAGAAIGGTELVVVRYDDADLEAAWLGEFPPPLGAAVLVAVYDHTPYILGRLNGVPPD